MARVIIPAKTPTVVSSGTANDIIIANEGNTPMALNTTDPSTAGAVVTLGVKDSVAMSAGGAWAAQQWVAYSEIGTVAVVTEV